MITYVIQDLPLEEYPLIQLLAMEYRDIEQTVSVLFMQNSVLLFKNRRFEDTYEQLKANNVTLYAVKSDIEARGINLDDKDVIILDYDQVVDLIMDQSSKVFNL